MRQNKIGQKVTTEICRNNRKIIAAKKMAEALADSWVFITSIQTLEKVNKLMQTVPDKVSNYLH